MPLYSHCGFSLSWRTWCGKRQEKYRRNFSEDTPERLVLLYNIFYYPISYFGRHNLDDYAQSDTHNRDDKRGKRKKY